MTKRTFAGLAVLVVPTAIILLWFNYAKWFAPPHRESLRVYSAAAVPTPKWGSPGNDETQLDFVWMTLRESSAGIYAIGFLREAADVPPIDPRIQDSFIDEHRGELSECLHISSGTFATEWVSPAEFEAIDSPMITELGVLYIGREQDWHIGHELRLSFLGRTVSTQGSYALGMSASPNGKWLAVVSADERANGFNLGTTGPFYVEFFEMNSGSRADYCFVLEGTDDLALGPNPTWSPQSSVVVLSNHQHRMLWVVPSPTNTDWHK